jgi:Ni/Co efflux regulator RcnB
MKKLLTIIVLAAVSFALASTSAQAAEVSHHHNRTPIKNKHKVKHHHGKHHKHPKA